MQLCVGRGGDVVLLHYDLRDICTHYCYTIYFNESTVLLTNTTNQPTVPLTYPWTASLPMITRDMLRGL